MPNSESEIRYTLDGSAPTRESALYSGPLTLRSTSDLKARAFRDGFGDSPIAEGLFINLVSNQMAFLKWDDFSSGSWLGKFGREGYLLPLGTRAPANYADVEFQGADTWLWSDSTEISSALQKGSSFHRMASCWFAQDSFTIDLSILDSQSHAIAFYFLDWDQKGRAENRILQ